jgi:hypothetical protein
MKKIEVRKTIALGMAAAYILFTGFCILTGKDLPNSFTIIVGSIIGFYFGKSTALDSPNKDTAAL